MPLRTGIGFSDPSFETGGRARSFHRYATTDAAAIASRMTGSAIRSRGGKVDSYKLPNEW